LFDEVYQLCDDDAEEERGYDAGHEDRGESGESFMASPFFEAEANGEEHGRKDKREKQGHDDVGCP